MISLRKGPNMLFLRTRDPQVTVSEIEEQGIAKSVNLKEGIRDSDEKSSLIFLTDLSSRKTRIEDARYILLSEDNGTEVLADLINSNIGETVSRVDIGTRSLVMRIPGNEETIMKALVEDFGGKPVSWKEGMEEGGKDQSLIWLTKKPLMSRLTEDDLLGEHLLIDIPTDELFDQLGRKVLLYINHSMADQDWYEYRINIYDSYGDYDKHYKRLMHVLTELEMGYVLGENWTKDHALALLSVVAYQIRLFSFIPPAEMKSILMGLEYDKAGKRLVDLDLYHRNKKIGWMETQKETKGNTKKRSKSEEGIFRSQELVKKLGEEASKKIR
ncbi:MAG: hypothetical protein D5S00_00510 [Tindallia sp. MSAO_Bac2]|nr:MAG: hypothetical protein D5S00_00510 [Tindallia sp. MSAO_Bac2]